MKFILFVLLSIWSPSVFAQEPISIERASRTAIEGVLLQVSKLPPPEGNAYPDCYYTATININQIVSGQSIPKKIILVLPGFFSREYAPEAKFKVGDKVCATVVPFASMPEKVKQTQQADEIEDTDLDFYFPQEITLIQGFQNISNTVPFIGKKQKNEESTNLQPIDLKARTARQETMRQDLEQISKLLSEHGGDWDKWYDSLKVFRTEYKKQYDAKAQRWVGDSFFSAGYLDNGKIYSSEFIKSIVAFKNYLAERNVDLILVRVPNKGEVVDDLFAPVPPDQISNPFLLRMYKDLLEADVEIITDIIPRAKEARLKYPLMYWFQDFAEPHPAEGIAWVVAESLAKRLNRYEKIRKAPKVDFRLRQVTTGTDISSDSHIYYWPEGNLTFNPKEYVRFSAVSFNDGKTLRPKQGSESPVLIVGSSFIEYPSLRLGGNIPTYLASLTGIVPDILYRSGSGVGIPRTIAREDNAFLKNRSVCLFPIQPWVFFDELSSPPIIDPAKSNKILLATYTGSDLRKQIQFAAETPISVFNFSSEGSLNIKAINQETRIGGSFRLILPPKISDFAFFMIEVESRNGDAAYFKAKYHTQTDTIYKSYSQSNSKDTLIFKSTSNHIVDFDISNIHITIPTEVKSIRIYGLQQ